MPDNSAIVESLLGSMKSKDPQTYAAIIQVAKDLYDLYNQVNVPGTVSSLNDGSPVVVVTVVTGFTITLFPDNIRLTWNAISGDVNFYELRLGSTWATAEILLTTTSLSANIDPVTHAIATGSDITFWVAAKDTVGNYGIPVSSTVHIGSIGEAIISPTVLNNFVLLVWTEPDSVFKIDHYNIYRDGVLYGIGHGTFTAIFELIAGTRSYTVQAVDIVGNTGDNSPGAVLTVTAPIDFVQRALLTSAFTGVKVNCKIDDNSEILELIAPINTTETYANHFITNGWTTLQDQVTAGYPLVIEPSVSTATYTEVFDFGSIFTGVIVSLDWATELFAGAVSITATIEASTDNITYDAPVAGTSRYSASLRYARVILTFTPSPLTKSIAVICTYRAALNVHREQDGGNVAVLASDVGGTVVFFNKAFKAIDSITLAPIGSTLTIPVFDFSFPANPVSFKILLFDNAGVRIDGNVGWDARGII